jgi:hypothetical protein
MFYQCSVLGLIFLNFVNNVAIDPCMKITFLGQIPAYIVVFTYINNETTG